MARCVEQFHVEDFEVDLKLNGIDPKKFWSLPKEQYLAILQNYTRIVSQQVSNRRFNAEVHKRISAKQKERFFLLLKKSGFYQKIASD